MSSATEMPLAAWAILLLQRSLKQYYNWFHLHAPNAQQSSQFCGWPGQLVLYRLLKSVKLVLISLSFQHVSQQSCMYSLRNCYIC